MYIYMYVYVRPGALVLLLNPQSRQQAVHTCLQIVLSDPRDPPTMVLVAWRGHVVQYQIREREWVRTFNPIVWF